MAIYRYLKVSHRGEVCIVRFAEAKLVNPVVEELGYEFQSVAALENSGKVLMNFAGVTFVASGLLGKLLLLNRRLKQEGGRLTLCEMVPQVRAIFSTMQLDQMFDILETEAEAFAALKRLRKNKLNKFHLFGDSV